MPILESGCSSFTKQAACLNNKDWLKMLEVVPCTTTWTEGGISRLVYNDDALCISLGGD